MVSTDTGKPATWSAPQHIMMLRSGQFSNRIKNEAVQCGTVSFFIILAESPWSALDVASSYYFVLDLGSSLIPRVGHGVGQAGFPHLAAKSNRKVDSKSGNHVFRNIFRINL